MLAMAEGQRRDERTSPKKVRWLYYLSVIFRGVFNLFVSHMLAMAEGQVVVTVMSMVTKTLT